MSRSSSFLGTGWSFPPSFTHHGNDVQMVSDAEDVHQSLDILLATRLGERVMLENYGCELSEFMFEEIDQSLLNNLSSLIENAITRHERRIKLDSVTITQSDALNGLLMIHMSYTIRTTNSRYNMVYPFYINEATNPVT
ncbi:MAG: hypothetical protein DRQ62_00290 [Gammaproteobacteria bacterium]|nr:MAG: hypothetical protein DRQ62_00290 [Gammaproteobacteria bacterium]